uniref:Pyridoxal phosphate homeostasis protein n=1 Tax=Toxoplasma gondii COUG TaxID=1074873 RepID=A0A2G8XR37_TOXGO|nr:pyridoxal phosphate enzyme, YggS family protein [Toxoplasma gondii COUG]
MHDIHDSDVRGVLCGWPLLGRLPENKAFVILLLSRAFSRLNASEFACFSRVVARFSQRSSLSSPHRMFSKRAFGPTLPRTLDRNLVSSFSFPFRPYFLSPSSPSPPSKSSLSFSSRFPCSSSPAFFSCSRHRSFASFHSPCPFPSLFWASSWPPSGQDEALRSLPACSSAAREEKRGTRTKRDLSFLPRDFSISLQEEEMAFDASSLDLLIRENLKRVREEILTLSVRRSVAPSAVNDKGNDAKTDSACSSLPSWSSCEGALRETEGCVRLLAVSKYQPASAVAAAALAGQRHFGENYVQELVEKATQLCHLDLKWHMIGHLQSNKAKQLLMGCPQLYAVETVDSKKLAKTLNDAVATVLSQRNGAPLRVLVQVNASDEASKSGVRLHSVDGNRGETETPCGDSEVRELVEYIVDSCPHLRFSGLMTIGHPDPERTSGTFAKMATLRLDLLKLPHVRQVFMSRTESAGEREAYDRSERKSSNTSEAARNTRNKAEEARPLHAAFDRDDLFELSMGMSGDMAEAIIHGSTEVRIGTAIFGSRPLQPKSRS